MLTLFYLDNCPYCKAARTYLAQLLPDYPGLEIKMIEESKEPKLANSYDYYYVPCFYQGNRKLHEGAISKEEVKQLLEEVTKTI